MSDGPHRSLLMRRPWQRVAERSDKRAFTPHEIGEAMTAALEQDCVMEMTPAFLAGIRRVAQEPLLFDDDIAARLEPLRSEAGSGMGRALLDNVAVLSSADMDDFTVLQKALEGTLQGRAYQSARSVEEHILRETTAARSNRNRGRLEEGIACTDFGAIATRFLGAKPQKAAGGLVKRSGLDDGVSLR
jgi:hypothetical protein